MSSLVALHLVCVLCVCVHVRMCDVCVHACVHMHINKWRPGVTLHLIF